MTAIIIPFRPDAPPIEPSKPPSHDRLLRMLSGGSLLATAMVAADLAFRTRDRQEAVDNAHLVRRVLAKWLAEQRQAEARRVRREGRPT